MKILYDDQIFTMQKYGGISRYFAELLNVFRQSDGIDYDLAIRFTPNFYARKYNLLNRSFSQRAENLFYSCVGRMERYAAEVAATKERINKEYKEKLFREAGFDLFHPTYYDPGFLGMIGDKPLVVTAHDMVHELFPEMYLLDEVNSQLMSQWKKAVFSRADKIIAVSECTKRDLVRLAGVSEGKIAVVHHASSIRLQPKKVCRFALPDKYILYVGERIRYKNFVPFIRAIAELLHKDRNLYLICAGGWGLMDAEKQLFAELSIDGQVLQFSVDDGTLAELYSRALMFAFPSLYEGFGMPILEAFSCGCPVVLSNASSFPEVAADAALYFDPADESSIRQAVDTLLHDRELREKLAKAGMKRGAHFSWEKTARETRSVYETVV